MKKTIHVYSFFEKTKGLKLTMTLCAFAFCLFASSNAFSQISHIQETPYVESPDHSVVVLEFLEGVFDYSDFDPVQGKLVLDAELNRLNNSIVIPSDEMAIKTHLIVTIGQIIDYPPTTAPDMAISAIYPRLQSIIANDNLGTTTEDLNEMVLDIASILE